MIENSTTDFEQIVFCYTQRKDKLTLIMKIDETFFKDSYCRLLFKLAKDFYTRFREPLFDTKNPDIGQIDVLVKEDKENYVVDVNSNIDENVSRFINISKHIISTNINNYSDDWLKETVGNWISWQNAQEGYKSAVKFMQTQTITPDNVKNVINRAKDMVVRRSCIDMHEAEVHDFWDAKEHIQMKAENYVNCGFSAINQAMSDFDIDGGFAPGTLTIFAGAPNSGKSIVLGNVAAGISLEGKNILLVSLEMGIDKLYKRIGSNILNIPIYEYASYAESQDTVQDALRNVIKSKGKVGRFLSVRYSKASPLTIVSDARRLEEEMDIHFDAIVIDYLTELGNDFGISPESMYSYHKSNAEVLFQSGVDNQWAMITAHQAGIKNANASDIEMGSFLSESSGLFHRADNVIGMITPDTMRMNKEFYFKFLKIRDSRYKDYYLKMHVEYQYMRMTEASGLLPIEQYRILPT